MHQRHKPGQPHLDDLRTTATGDAYNIQMIRTLCNEFNGYDLARCHGVAGPVGSCGSTVSTSTIAGPSWKLYDGYNVEYAPSDFEASNHHANRHVLCRLDGPPNALL
ncbi:hypothetical protein PIIN_10015 [Serendipita indica DSM 11827]|uniref:Uncharacterized protein n=1 Tax=Serendipita indica (strain DSM 11827) TaxID=1109443 RepID=G4TXH2_SERID|nr:hypothetical protein PIIN_10015 [Serendipita indica DSM 11827]